MPYKSSNMPYKMFYSTISAEVLRICRATSNYSFFLDSAKKLISRMSKQGADAAVGIKKVVTKMMCRHWQPFEKFDIPLEQITSDISSYCKILLKSKACKKNLCSARFNIN